MKNKVKIISTVLCLLLIVGNGVVLKKNNSKLVGRNITGNQIMEEHRPPYF